MSVHQLSLPHLGQGQERAAARNRRLPTFFGAKTPQPIETVERWQRDVLIALSLDPKVLRIESVGAPAPRGSLFDLGVTLAGGPVILRIVSDEAAVHKAQPLRGVVHLTTGDFLKSPAAEARRAVWASRGRRSRPPTVGLCSARSRRRRTG